ncbi:hypothetical protein C8R42DRAFT_724929 [Lentinula raphanica]|nr:hypothetical protein C8R42DRAFT_724929 [Lentinula raphanica]
MVIQLIPPPCNSFYRIIFFRVFSPFFDHLIRSCLDPLPRLSTLYHLKDILNHVITKVWPVQVYYLTYGWITVQEIHWDILHRQGAFQLCRTVNGLRYQSTYHSSYLCALFPRSAPYLHSGLLHLDDAEKTDVCQTKWKHRHPSSSTDPEMEDTGLTYLLANPDLSDPEASDELTYLSTNSVSSGPWMGDPDANDDLIYRSNDPEMGETGLTYRWANPDWSDPETGDAELTWRWTNPYSSDPETGDTG